MGSVDRVLHIWQSDAVKDIAALLEKIRQGSEVIIEEDHCPIAVIKAPSSAGRRISEVIRELEARGSDAIIDDSFAADIQAGIEASSEPWNPPSWE